MRIACVGEESVSLVMSFAGSWAAAALATAFLKACDMVVRRWRCAVFLGTWAVT